MPELSDPLGQPYIIKPEDWINLAKASGYAPGTTSILPTMTALTNLGSSLVDNAYSKQIEYAQAKANLQQTMARTRGLDADTDIIQRTADDKVAQEHLITQLKQQDYDNRKQLDPILTQQQQNKLDIDRLTLEATKRQQQDQTDAIAMVPEATSALPDPDDPNYVDKRDQWRLKYNRLLTNPATRTRMEGEYAAVDGIYQSRILSQETAAKRKEFGDLQMNGFIPSPINPDAAMKSADADNLLAKGRMLQARHSIEGIASQFPADNPARRQLQTILDEADRDTGSDTGVQDVMAGKSKVFDTNGRLTGVAQGALQQAQNVLAAQGKAELAKPQTEVEVPFGKPNVKGEYPGKMVIKGVEPSVGEQWAQRYGLTLPGPQPTPEAAAGANLIQDPAVRDLAGRYQRREITRDQFINELKKLPTPSAPATGPGGSAQPTRTPTSNNDYQFPAGASNHLGINQNVWANVMSEEGREFGKDGSHDSVFGLWADSPGTEGEAYRAVKDNGPNSLAAYNAVTNAWTNKFLRQSEPWNLRSPGLQEMVIADSQHAGGDKARAIIDSMGGFEKVNSMPADQAIREYSERRKPLWPGNNKPFPDGASDRVTRERNWALAHNDELS
jgi:hypothetical protein